MLRLTRVLICLSLSGCSIKANNRVELIISFPEKDNSNEQFSKYMQQEYLEYKEFTIEGKIAGYTPCKMQAPLAVDNLKKIHPNMTFDDFINTFGPGYLPENSGCGILSWYFEDNNVLCVWPELYKLKEIPRYWISNYGQNRRHEIVKKLALEIIESIVILKDKVCIVCTKDLVQCKAGKSREYKVGDAFQKVEPFPRIDFDIITIYNDGIQCNYFYQSGIENNYSYSDVGKIVIKIK